MITYLQYLKFDGFHFDLIRANFCHQWSRNQIWTEIKRYPFETMKFGWSFVDIHWNL